MTNNIVEERLKNGQFVLIAEIGVNYYDIAKKLNITPMEAAKMMVLEARNAGVHACKFQTYKAETLASKNSPSYWDTTEEKTTSQYQLFKKFDAFGVKEYRELKEFCDQIGIEFCSTPFDFESADYLEPLMNFYKISSSDLSNLPFIAYIAKKNKPIICLPVRLTWTKFMQPLTLSISTMIKSLLCSIAFWSIRHPMNIRIWEKSPA